AFLRALPSFPTLSDRFRSDFLGAFQVLHLSALSLSGGSNSISLFLFFDRRPRHMPEGRSWRKI
ncbi:hypothetical protein, partial [Streptomyces fragilis]